MAKIERAEAIENLTQIVDSSDEVMVARGDLGVEIGDAELPGLQKKIIRESVAREKVVITATQMLQSMVDSPIPVSYTHLDVYKRQVKTSMCQWPMAASPRICASPRPFPPLSWRWKKAQR